MQLIQKAPGAITPAISKFASRILVIGTLRSNHADGNENVKKKTFGLISKTTTSHVLTFLYISFLFLHHYYVKIPNFATYGGLKQATTKKILFLFLSLAMVP